MKNENACPTCAKHGKPVKTVTLRALLREEEKPKIRDDSAGYAFCQTAACPMVYFNENGDSVFEKDALTVRVGIKEREAPRPICYCFDHTIEEIEEEITRTGRSSVLDDIRTRMKDGCWCETKSPMGSCCLGTVSRFANAASVADDCCAEPEAEDCCAVTSASPKDGQKAGLFATGGAVISAIFSSACCWLPLSLVAFGMSAAGVAGFFETFRVWFLAATALLLGVGFYLLYFRPLFNESKNCCDPSKTKLLRFNRVMLWCAAAMAAAFAVFPNLTGMLLGESEAMPPGLTPLVFEISGMTCEGCAVSLQERLVKVDGADFVSIDYANRTATIGVSPDHDRLTQVLTEAIKDVGYSGTVVSSQ